jgi:hypothetical protein
MMAQKCVRAGRMQRRMCVPPSPVHLSRVRITARMTPRASYTDEDLLITKLEMSNAKLISEFKVAIHKEIADFKVEVKVENVRLQIVVAALIACSLLTASPDSVLFSFIGTITSSSRGGMVARKMKLTDGDYVAIIEGIADLTQTTTNRSKSTESTKSIEVDRIDRSRPNRSKRPKNRKRDRHRMSCQTHLVDAPAHFSQMQMCCTRLQTKWKRVWWGAAGSCRYELAEFDEKLREVVSRKSH